MCHSSLRTSAAIGSLGTMGAAESVGSIGTIGPVEKDNAHEPPKKKTQK